LLSITPGSAANAYGAVGDCGQPLSQGSLPSAVVLHLENITGQSMEVWIDTDYCINGYQFTVSGATVGAALLVQ